MTMDAVTSSSSASVSVSINQTIELLMEIDEEDFEQESLVIASAELKRIVPVLNELLRVNVSASAGLSDAIDILNAEVVAANKLMLECSHRSKVFLLLNCRVIVKQLEGIMKRIGNALSIISVASVDLPGDLVKEIEILSERILAMEFKISVEEERVMEKIETGMQERVFDPSYANSFLTCIAEAVGISLEQSAMRKMVEEFKAELGTIQLRKNQAECIQMDQIVSLLGRADSLFTIEEKIEKYLAKRNSLGNQLVEPLEAFYCPISGDVMVNPVETSSGHTFERGEIEKWFSEGKGVCPLTMIPVDTSSLRPNKNLRLAIEEWKDRNTIITIVLLKQQLVEENPDVLQCLKQLQCICEEKAAHCEWVVFENYLPTLANLLGAKNRDITKGALRVLGILWKNNDDVKEIIAQVDNVIPLVVRSLGRPADERKLAISLLLDMSKSDTLLDLIGKVHGCILLVVTMSRSDNNQEAKKAQELLECLSVSKQCTLQMAKANYFKPLLQLLASESEDVQMLMTKTLSEMEMSIHSKLELVENGVLSLLLPLFSNANVELKKLVIGALHNLSTLPQNGLRMIRENVARTLLDQLKQISFASQSWCEPVVATIMNLCISTKFQDGDQVQVKLFENDDDIFRLFTLNAVTGPSTQQKILQAFQASCQTPEATMVKRVLMQCSALRMLIKFCENGSLRVRSNAMSLLSFLVEDSEHATLIENQLDKKSIENILSTVNSFDEEQDVTSVICIISNLSTQIRGWLLEAKAVSVICSVIKKRTKSKELTERAVGALARFISPSDLASQKIASKVGVIPLLVNLLVTGTTRGKMQAAVCLSKFSANSHTLSRKVQHHRALACFSSSPEPVCRIHEGICSVETSFCLVEADAVDPLVKLLAESNEAACEASLDALLTLINIPRLEEGCKLLAEAEGIPSIIKLLSSPSQSLQEKALVALERIFTVAEYNAKYESSAQLAVVDIATRGTISMRSLAAKTLAHMHVLYDQSSYF